MEGDLRAASAVFERVDPAVWVVTARAGERVRLGIRTDRLAPLG